MRRAHDLLASHGVVALSLAEPGLPEPDVIASTARETAVTKACTVASLTGLPAFKEEQFFSIDALDGRYRDCLPARSFPRALTKTHVEQLRQYLQRYHWLSYEPKLPADPVDGLVQMLNEPLEHLACYGSDDRNASLSCAICLAWPDNEHRVVECHLDGQLTWDRRGNDPSGIEGYFIPDPDGLAATLAEMEPEARHATEPRTYAYAEFSRRLRA